MNHHVKQGWRLAMKHFYIIIMLFLYELLWGFFLYRAVEGIIVPLLKRYPDSAPSDGAVNLFLTEAQFQLLKTDLIRPYIWLFAILLAARMLLTPFLNAGLFHSLHHSHDADGTKFLQGIRKSWKPIALLYTLETALALAPGIWLLPKALAALLSSGSLADLTHMAGPWVFGWLAWVLLLHLLFLAMQFGVVAGTSPARSLWGGMRHLLPLAGISLLMWAIGMALSLTMASASMIWAGLIALILHQSYHLIRTIMKVWTVASQYEVWHSKQT
ncbi:hypothetical protein [Paenibacillus nasutitermitis]|uniref:Uncharacterized protein n=1 Tax=Paenibacillus nasutitermitis TaxID=1652958 RepID=A0A916ZHA9_9BACL|nr:hypothetical protein [Paenibacillus nasutitermitis]GGD95870.1 hypothetical protein GCM10010911_63130 [Paenibacillus nasutitermitis]